jgi:pilus assembly protein Flp/PilA
VNHPRPKKLPLPVRLAEFVHPAGRRRKSVAPALLHLLHDESGQDLIEYALVAALVGLGAVAALKGLKNSIDNTFNSIGSSLTNSV